MTNETGGLYCIVMPNRYSGIHEPTVERTHVEFSVSALRQ